MKKSELKKFIREALNRRNKLKESSADEIKAPEITGVKGTKNTIPADVNVGVKKSEEDLTTSFHPKTAAKKLPGCKTLSSSKIAEEIVALIKESVEEYRTKGALGQHNPNRKLPVKATGLNYQAKNPRKTDLVNPESPIGLNVYLATFDDIKKAELLDFDFLNNTQGRARQYLETEVMATVPDALTAKISPEVYVAIEKAKENDLDGKLTPQNNTIVLWYDKATKQLRAKTKLEGQIKETKTQPSAVFSPQDSTLQKIASGAQIPSDVESGAKFSTGAGGFSEEDAKSVRQVASAFVEVMKTLNPAEMHKIGTKIYRYVETGAVEKAENLAQGVFNKITNHPKFKALEQAGVDVESGIDALGIHFGASEDEGEMLYAFQMLFEPFGIKFE